MKDTLPVGVTGAKRQTQKLASPRSLLRQVMDENMEAGEATIRNRFATAARDDDEMIDAIIEYWFANNYHRIISNPERTEARSKDLVSRKQEKQATSANLADIIKTRAERMVLLNMVMPNGKPLRDCTGKETAKFGNKFLALSKAVKPNEKIGVLSEDTVRKLFK